MRSYSHFRPLSAARSNTLFVHILVGIQFYSERLQITSCNQTPDSVAFGPIWHFSLGSLQEWPDSARCSGGSFGTDKDYVSVGHAADGKEWTKRDSSRNTGTLMSRQGKGRLADVCAALISVVIITTTAAVVDISRRLNVHVGSMFRIKAREARQVYYDDS